MLNKVTFISRSPTYLDKSNKLLTFVAARIGDAHQVPLHHVVIRHVDDALTPHTESPEAERFRNDRVLRRDVVPDGTSEADEEEHGSDQSHDEGRRIGKEVRWPVDATMVL